jgi:hypothetical protein
MASDYDEKAIRESLLSQWNGDDLFILPYRSKRSGANDAVTDFILDFKGGYPQAMALGTKLIVDVAESFENVFRRAACGYILAAPPHGVGKAKAPGEAACKALAEALELKHLVGALERIEAVQKAAYAPPGGRPGYLDHVRTIRYDGPKLNLKGKGVILFDDLLTRGDTSMACRKIITDATDCSKVIGIFFGRTL